LSNVTPEEELIIIIIIITILWNKQVQTDRTVRYKKPDVIIHDNKKGTCVTAVVAFRETEM
jgi:hypothetical protein